MMRKIDNESLAYIFILLYFIGLIGFLGGIILLSTTMLAVGFALLFVVFLFCIPRVWDKLVQRDKDDSRSKFPSHLITEKTRPLWFDIFLNIGLALMIGIFVKYL